MCSKRMFLDILPDVIRTVVLADRNIELNQIGEIRLQVSLVLRVFRCFLVVPRWLSDTCNRYSCTLHRKVRLKAGCLVP